MGAGPIPHKPGDSLFRRGLGADEREFLPAALEIVETPPSPTGRAFALTIVLFFVAALAWAFLGKVDILATAPGRVLPAGEVKVIQPLDPGLVRAIRVQNGDHVHAGDVLIELDPTQTGADRTRVAHDLMQARLDVARLTALKATLASGRAPADLAVPEGATPEQLQEARAALHAQADQQAARIADLTQQISQKEAEEAEVAAERAKLNASLPMLTQKEQIHRELTRQGFGTSLQYLDAQQQLSDARQQQGVLAQREAQASAARLALEGQRNEARSRYAADTLSDLRKAEEQENELSQELVKAQNKSTQTSLRAPIDGVVDQLAIHTLGGVVTPAQHLMIIVPDSGALTVEARLSNRDVGFVHLGQKVQVKIETFAFTRYGLVEGRVLNVSRDVVSPDPNTNDPVQSPERRLGQPSYIARIALNRTTMMIDGRSEPLQPGMAITAEIRTGDRTIIDYLLSPLARRTQESLHER